MTVIETDRLQLRHWQASDYEYFVQCFTNPVAAKYIGGIKNREECWRKLATYIGHQQLKGYSYMAVVEKNTTHFLGAVGLWDSEPWPEIELGYWFLPASQGKGYATEAARAVKDFAFAKIKTNTLVSYIHPGNTPSIQLAKRIGGVYDKTINLIDFGEHQVYRYGR